MKKIILFVFTLLTFNSFSQDSDYLNKLKEGVQTEAEVIELTKPITELSKKPLRFFKAKDFTNEHYFIVQYVPEELSDEDISKDLENIRDQFLIFQFRYMNVGENVNLEVPGVKKYFFYDVRGKYLSLFPFWKKYFNQDSDMIKLSEKSREEKKDYYFYGSNGNWKISKI